MALSGGLTIPNELQILFDRLLRQLAPRTSGAVGLNRGMMTRKAKRDVALRSLLPECSELWAGLSQVTKDAWSAAGAVSNYSGWNLFVQDTSYRLKFGIAGLATPSELHQYKVGHVLIEAPAVSASIVQLHPRRYFITRKISGSKGLYEDIAISESLVLPLEVGASYRADLQSTGDNSYARFSAIIESHYQGRKIYTDTGFNIDLQSGWTRSTKSISEVLGVARSYVLQLDLNNVRGWLEFDTVLAFHSGINWARDFRCTNINQPLTATHFMVSPSWQALNTPVGVDWGSLYPSDA